MDERFEPGAVARGGVETSTERRDGVVSGAVDALGGEAAELARAMFGGSPPEDLAIHG